VQKNLGQCDPNHCRVIPAGRLVSYHSWMPNTLQRWNLSGDQGADQFTHDVLIRTKGGDPSCVIYSSAPSASFCLFCWLVPPCASSNENSVSAVTRPANLVMPFRHSPVQPPRLHWSSEQSRPRRSRSKTNRLTFTSSGRWTRMASKGTEPILPQPFIMEAIWDAEWEATQADPDAARLDHFICRMEPAPISRARPGFRCLDRAELPRCPPLGMG